MSEHHQTTLMADGEGVIRMVSASAADLLGTTARDLEGLHLHALLETPPPDVVSAVLRSLEDQGRAGGSGAVRMAARLRLPDGRLAEIDLHLSRVPQTGENEAATLVRIVEVGAHGVAGNVVALSQTGESPAVPAEIKTAVIDDAYLVCRGGLIIQAGGGMEGLTGLPPARLIGWSIKNLVASEDLMPVIEILRDVEHDLDGRNDFGFHLLRAEQLPPLEVAARARRIIHRNAPAVLVGLRDISDSLRSARLAADKITHLDAALEATGDAVLILGHPAADSPILLASRTIDSFFGVRGTSWIGKPFRDFWESLRGSFVVSTVEAGALDPLPVEADEIRVDRVLLSRPEGRVLEKYLGPLKSPEGAVLGRICIFRDVTRRTQAELEMRRSAQEAGAARAELEMLHEEVRLANEGLERRLSDMQRLNKDLKVLDEMKSNLLANVSHELQTPLVSIKGLTEMILKGRLGSVTPEQERGLQVALRNINRLIGLIENLLAFARTDGSTTTLKLEAFPLEALVNEAIELVAERATGRGITIKTQMPPDGLIIRADRDKIMQVLLNLLTNAVKYNRDGGEVLVEANGGPKGTARIEVRDGGIGIPREEIDRIFDRYFQAGNITQPREGEGIGLAITKDILRQHGCMIRADSEEGKGSLFSFTLPLDRKPRQERGIPRSGVPGKDPAEGEKEPEGQRPAPAGRPRPTPAREES